MLPYSASGKLPEGTGEPAGILTDDDADFDRRAGGALRRQGESEMRAVLGAGRNTDANVPGGNQLAGTGARCTAFQSHIAAFAVSGNNAPNGKHSGNVLTGLFFVPREVILCDQVGRAVLNQKRMYGSQFTTPYGGRGNFYSCTSLYPKGLVYVY